MTTTTLTTSDRDELKRSPLSPFIRAFLRVRRTRRIGVRLAQRFEGGPFLTRTLRRHLEEAHGVRVGAHTYGPCLVPGAFPSGVEIGRYVSIGPSVRVFRRNHPLDRLTMHPYFYNQDLGVVERDTIESRPLTIGHDAWIGDGAVITPGCERIGIGAVVGAGAVVTKDVPAFAVVGGNPAKLIRMRFDEPTIDRLLASRWWEMTRADLAEHTEELCLTLGEAALRAVNAPGREAVRACA